MMRSAADRGAAHATASCAGASGAAFPKCGREGGDSLWFAASLRVDLRSLPCSRHSNRTFRFPRRPSASASHPSCSHRPRRGGRWSADRRTRLFHRACEARSAALARHGPSRCNRDALSALHRGDFRPGTRAVVSGSGTGADQRSARCRAVRPGGRGPGPPALRFRAASRGTPRLAPPAGSSPETPLMSEDTNLCVAQIRYVVNSEVRM
jgi:hypothetical protein